MEAVQFHVLEFDKGNFVCPGGLGVLQVRVQGMGSLGEWGGHYYFNDSTS